MRRTTKPERRELVEYLSGEGMSTRAIAPIVGVDQKTVVRDIRREANASPPQSPSDPLGAEPIVILSGVHVDALTGEITDAAPAEPTRTVTGLDGKTYRQPAAAPRRSQS